MQQKQVNRPVRNKHIKSRVADIPSIAINTARAVMGYYRDSVNPAGRSCEDSCLCLPRQRFVWGFIVGLSTLALTAYNPALAQEGWESQGGEQREHDSEKNVTAHRQFIDNRVAQPMYGRESEANQHVRRQAVVLRVAANQIPERTSVQAVNIPAGDLHAALLALGRQTNLQLLYPPELITGLQTKGVRGTMTPKQALEELLVGTSLHFQFSDESTAILQAASTSQAIGNGKNSGKNQKDDDMVIQADPIVIEETITRSKIFLPTVDGYKADQTTSITRTALPITETPSSIGVVTRDVIRDTLSRSQNDAFEHVSGLARANRTYSRSESFSIRGFRIGTGSSSGRRSNGLPSDNSFALDPALIERWEIIKGPASITGGASSPGGTVNRITKSPQDTNFLTTQFQAGSYDLYRGVVDVNGVLPQNKNVRGRLIFVVEEGGYFVDDVDIREYTVAPSLEIDVFSGAGTLLLTGHYQKFDGSSYIGFPLLENGNIPDISRARNVGGGSDNGAKSTYEGQNYQMHYKHEFINDLTLSVKGGYSKSDQTEKVLYGYNYGRGIPPSGDSDIYGKIEDNDREIFSGEIFLSKEFQALGQNHEVLLGVDYRDVNNPFLIGYSFLGTDNIFNPSNNFPLPSDGELRDLASQNFDVDLNQFGVFSQVVARPIQGLTLVGAFRHDWAETKNMNFLTNVNREETYSKSTGRLGATYELFPGLRLYGGFAQSFQVSSFGVMVNGELLPPETGENYEVGAKLDLLNGRLRLTTALFRTYRQNVSTVDSKNPGFRVAIGEQRHQGVEFDINGQLWPGLNLTGNFSYIDAEITEDNQKGNVGSTPTQVPRSYIGKVFATYQLQSGPLEGLGLGGGVYFQNGYELETPNRIKTDAYERVDAIVFYRPPQKAYEFTINVRNLLDATYIESPGLANAFNSFGAPRTVVGTLRINFSPDLDWSLW